MIKRYLNFIRGVSSNRLGKLGIILTTSAFLTMIALELARLAGLLTNAYVGLVTYMALPLVFIVGLLLIPLGWRRLKRTTGKTSRELLNERFAAEETGSGFFGSGLFRTIALLTVVNVVFLVFVSSQMLGFMDQPRFCGTACHSVMHPEWTTYQVSPHARVKCVECHVGEGVDALVDSKLNGLWQIISVTFDLLERPIPTPVHQLRPARETCEKCHWPDKFYGSRLKTIVHYERDEASTPTYTTLNLKVDAGKAGYRSGIHWHVAAANEVRYSSVEDEREEMIWVEARQSNGYYRRYVNQELSVADSDKQEARTLDCVDCHNRATHIYEDPEVAIDERIRRGLLPTGLPYLKREALSALTGGYRDTVAAREGIANQLHGFYQREYPRLARERAVLVDSIVQVLGGIYTRNIFPTMNINWGAYPSHIGHHGRQGCFRCHNPEMVDESGVAIRYDCTMCHSILAQDQSEPFKFLQPADTTDPDYPMHIYLQQEFWESYQQ